MFGERGRAWFAVAGGFLALFVAFGFAYSFGVFFDSVVREFGVGSGAGAFFFSITSFVFFSFGAVSGPVSDLVGVRKVLVVGAAMIFAGLFGTAMSESLWQAYAAYGLGVGIGVGCVYVPVVAAVGRLFERGRSTALGVTVSGIGLGTLALAPLSAWLVNSYGWRDVYMGYAFVGAVLILVAAAMMRTPPKSSGPARTDTRWGGRLYARLYAATLLINVALYVPFAHLPSAAARADVSPVAAAGLVGVIGVASVLGRILLGGIGEWVGLLALYKGCFAAISVGFVSWMAADGYAMLLVFAIVFGVGYGGYIALTPAVLAALFGLEGLGRLLGVLYTAVGVGAALGTSLVGAAVDATGNYAFALAGLVFVSLAGTLVMLPFSEVTGR